MKRTTDSAKTTLIGASIGGLGALWLGKQIQRHMRKMDLSGKTVLITGGSRGLGLALAREFARHRAKVAICARNAAELKVAAEDVRQLGGRVEAFECDLRDKAQIAGMIQKIESELGVIEVVVNNAGTIIVGPQETMTLEDYEQVMAVNFWSALHTSTLLAPAMAARGRGRIVNIASVGGKMPVPHLLPYCASKFALVGFSTGLRAELIRSGVYVSTIIPGLMRTGSPRNASFKGNHEAEFAWFTLGDGMPGLSMSAAGAARRIVQATVYGEAEVTLGLPAKIGAAFYGIAPNLHAEVSGWVNRLLPGPTGSAQIKLGRESESSVTRSPLTYFNRVAEKNLNQLPAQ